ncbi:MAG: ADP-ribose pyrophosphatase [Actinomycetota bacterium]|jgi:ADP-ribose pyrophosphatase|nr:ADP-ribose pyrophosphatase [Actinomycetota bacterium]
MFRGHTISAGIGVFEAPDGSTFERDLVHHPGAVSVVPVVEEGTAVLLVRQFRAAIDRDLLEVPAGTCDVEGERPEQTAHRELAEEVGMRAGRMEWLCEFQNSPGFCDEHSWIYLALDLEPAAISRQGVEEQHMTIEKVSLDDVPSMIADGRITDAKTIIGLMLTREKLA